MTPLQRRALDYIERYYAASRIAPTYREICSHLGLASKGGASRIVHGLLRQGALIRTGGHARGIVPASADWLRGVDTSLLRAELARREALHG